MRRSREQRSSLKKRVMHRDHFFPIQEALTDNYKPFRGIIASNATCSLRHERMTGRMPLIF